KMTLKKIRNGSEQKSMASACLVSAGGRPQPGRTIRDRLARSTSEGARRFALTLAARPCYNQLIQGGAAPAFCAAPPTGEADGRRARPGRSRGAALLLFRPLSAAPLVGLSRPAEANPNDRGVSPGGNIEDAQASRHGKLWVLHFKFRDPRLIKVN